MFGGVYGAFALTCSSAVPTTLPDVAVMFASPADTPVASPVPLTVAIDGADVPHVNVTPVMGWFDASNAVAVNCCVPFTLIVAGDGVTVMLATTGGGGGAPESSLHTPKVFGAGAFQVPSLLRCSDWPIGVVLLSFAPMLTDVVPSAGPLVAAKVPPYDRNSMTVPPASTSAMPSGSPFWSPFTA